MKQLFLFAVVMLTVLSCQKTNIKAPEKPENLISEAKMVDVLYDMALLSAAKGINKKLMENKGIQPDSFIYNKYKIDSVQFAKSNAYYAYDIDAYKGIYTRVKNRLQKDKKEFNVILDAEKKKRDSTLKANRKRDSLKKKNRTLNKKVNTPKKPRLLEKNEKSPQLKRQ